MFSNENIDNCIIKNSIGKNTLDFLINIEISKFISE